MHKDHKRKQGLHLSKYSIHGIKPKVRPIYQQKTYQQLETIYQHLENCTDWMMCMKPICTPLSNKIFQGILQTNIQQKWPVTGPLIYNKQQNIIKQQIKTS